jgi:hypothetical protein
VEKDMQVLDATISFLKNSKREKDIRLRLLSGLRQAYKDYFGAKNPHTLIEQRIVNEELWLLKKMLDDLQTPVLESFMNRLEDLYVTMGESSFEVHPGELNEKVQSIGGLMEQIEIEVDWSRFPIMQTLFVSVDRLLDETMDSSVDYFNNMLNRV